MPGQGETSLRDTSQHLGAEHLGKRLMAEQVLAFLDAPSPLFMVDSPRRHDKMSVRVKVKPTRVRVCKTATAPGVPCSFLSL